MGTGAEINNDTVIMILDVENAVPIKYLGFSTGWGSTGEFRLWTKADAQDTGYGEVFHLGIPDNAVPDSAKATAQIVGKHAPLCV